LWSIERLKAALLLVHCEMSGSSGPPKKRLRQLRQVAGQKSLSAFFSSKTKPLNDPAHPVIKTGKAKGPDAFVYQLSCQWSSIGWRRGGHLCRVADNTVLSHWQVASRSSDVNFTKNYSLRSFTFIILDSHNYWPILQVLSATPWITVRLWLFTIYSHFQTRCTYLYIGGLNYVGLCTLQQAPEL